MTITIHSKCWHSARLLQLMVALLSNLVQDEAGDGASNRSGLIRQLSILSSCLGNVFFLNEGTGVQAAVHVGDERYCEKID